MMSQRPIRVGRSMQAALSDLLARGVVKDPRVADAGLVTVTEVRVTEDLGRARVYVSVYAEEPKRGEAIRALRRAAGFVRREVGRTLRLRTLPQIEFVLDDSLERGARIGRILSDLGRDG